VVDDIYVSVPVFFPMQKSISFPFPFFFSPLLQFRGAAEWIALVDDGRTRHIFHAIGFQFISIQYVFVTVKGSEEVDVAVRGVYGVLQQGAASTFVTPASVPASFIPAPTVPSDQQPGPVSYPSLFGHPALSSGLPPTTATLSGLKAQRLPMETQLEYSYVGQRIDGNGEDVGRAAANDAYVDTEGSTNYPASPFDTASAAATRTLSGSNLAFHSRLAFPELLYGSWLRLETDGFGVDMSHADSRSSSSAFSTSSRSATPTSVMIRFTPHSYERLERFVQLCSGELDAKNDNGHAQDNVANTNAAQPRTPATGTDTGTEAGTEVNADKETAEDQKASSRTMRTVELQHQHCQVSRMQCAWLEESNKGGASRPSVSNDGSPWNHQLDAGWQIWSPSIFSINPHTRANITVQLHGCGEDSGDGNDIEQGRSRHGGRATGTAQQQLHFTLMQLSPSINPSQHPPPSPPPPFSFHATSPGSEPASSAAASFAQFVLVEFGMDGSRRVYVRVDVT